MPSLVVERGQEKGFSFALRPAEVTVIGRDPANQIIISDPASSRRHFQIRCGDGIWLVTDLGSRNLTYVNEEQLEHEQALAFGDRIQVGETVFSFLEEEQSDKGKAAGLAGKDLAGYKILERVGRGGMGTVYKARQISLNRICAFKILSTKYATDPSFVEKFVAEARAAAQLNHPNVVQVFDVGQASGIHFFSMEFMEGGAVQDLLSKSEDSRLPWIEALPLMIDACRGLVFAERHGIVHRDIKPDNLMLTVENKVKIGDLGLAARADQTGDGKIFGTPHFIAPEQARGKDVTHTADIYSLGASFYRVVTGRTPFSGQTVKEILRKQVNDPHVPVVNEVEDFPPDLSAIIDKMMAKKVEERYQSATDLLAEFEAFEIEHKIELAGGRKRNKGILAVAAVVILGLGGVVAWQLAKEPEIIDTGTNTVTEVIRDTGIAPEALAAQAKAAAESDARAAYYQLKDKDPGSEIDRAQAEAWFAQADEYDRLATQHAGTPAAGTATDRATEIRTTIETAQKEWEATVGRAKAWWEQEQALITDQLTAENWSKALAAVTSVPASRKAKEHLPHVPEAAAFLGGLEVTVLKRARTSFDGLIPTATKLLEGGKPGEAIASVVAWADEMRKHAQSHADLAQLEIDARAWADEQGETIAGDLDNSLIEDRLAYIVASRSFRAVPATEGVPSVFDWDFAGAAATLRDAGKGLRTWLYQDRAKVREAELAAAGAGWTAFIAALADGELVAAEDQLTHLPNLPPGATITLSTSKRVSKKSFSVDVAFGPASSRRTYEWVDMTPDGVWNVLLRDRVDRLPGETAAGLARVFVEVLHADAAAALMARAESAGSSLTPAQSALLAHEIAALRAYQGVRDAVDITPAQRMAKVKDFRDRYSLTETFVVLDGRSPTALPELVSPIDRERFLATWGIRPQ